jgi:hypothetical protein
MRICDAAALLCDTSAPWRAPLRLARLFARHAAPLPLPGSQDSTPRRRVTGRRSGARLRRTEEPGRQAGARGAQEHTAAPDCVGPGNQNRRAGARDAQAHHHHQLRDGDDPPAAPLPERVAAKLVVPAGRRHCARGAALAPTPAQNANCTKRTWWPRLMRPARTRRLTQWGSGRLGCSAANDSLLFVGVEQHCLNARGFWMPAGAALTPAVTGWGGGRGLGRGGRGLGGAGAAWARRAC